MTSENEKENREELFRLMQENPELPVVAMVNSEIVADDGYSYWRGAFGSVSVGEYFAGDEKLHFREDDDLYEVDNALDDYLDTEAYESIETDAEALTAYAELPWIKAIIIYIELPE